MGRRKACEANEGTCVRLVRLVALGGLLKFVMEPPGPPNAPPILHEAIVVGEPIPLRDGGARVEGRVCDDIAEPGRFGSIEAAVVGLPPIACLSPWNSSPSSDAISVIRDEMTLGACWEPDVGRGLGKELLTGVRGEGGEREGSIVTDEFIYGKVLFANSFGPVEHVQVRRRATWNTDSGKEK